MIRLIRIILGDYADRMTPTSTVIILRLIIEIFESKYGEVSTTKTDLMRRYLFSRPSIASALSDAKSLGILNLEKEEGFQGVTISICEELLNEKA